MGSQVPVHTERHDATNCIAAPLLKRRLLVRIQIPFQSRRTQAFLEYYIYKIGVVIPFSMTVTIDADLSSNTKGFKHLSDIADAPSRTFKIRRHDQYQRRFRWRLVTRGQILSKSA
jgi:hypothetical protein